MGIIQRRGSPPSSFTRSTRGKDAGFTGRVLSPTAVAPIGVSAASTGSWPLAATWPADLAQGRHLAEVRSAASPPVASPAGRRRAQLLLASNDSQSLLCYNPGRCRGFAPADPRSEAAASAMAEAMDREKDSDLAVVKAMEASAISGGRAWQHGGFLRSHVGRLRSSGTAPSIAKLGSR